MKKMIYKMARLFIRLILPMFNISFVTISVKDARKNLKKLCEERELFSQEDIVNLETDRKIDLSIIIPVYNVEKYLVRCLQSVVCQETQYHFEVIVINDGSTDGSMEILKEYEQKYDYFKVITQENQGLSGARNTGINHAQGKFITFIDSDDAIEKQYIEKMMKVAIEKDVDLVMCSIREYDVVNDKTIRFITHENVSFNKGIKDEILNLKGYAWGKIYRRELWEKVRFPKEYLFEDAITRPIMMRLCHSFAFINEAVYSYTVRPDSLSRKAKEKRKSKKYLEQYFMLEKILELSEKIGLPNDNILYKIALYELGTCLWLRTRYFEEDIKKAVFVLSCDLIEKYRVEEAELSFEYQYLEKAFQNKNYVLWKMMGIYMMLGVKLKNG